MQGKKILTTKEIGARIKKRRTELGISQEDLAETLGVTYQQVQRYENGTNRLNVENIQLIAQTLSMCVSDLLGPAEKAEPQLHAQETKLMRYFRKIGDERSKNLVIQVARLGAKAEGAGNGLKRIKK